MTGVVSPLGGWTPKRSACTLPYLSKCTCAVWTWPSSIFVHIYHQYRVHTLESLYHVPPVWPTCTVRPSGISYTRHIHNRHIHHRHQVRSICLVHGLCVLALPARCRRGRRARRTGPSCPCTPGRRPRRPEEAAAIATRAPASQCWSLIIHPRWW